MHNINIQEVYQDVGQRIDNADQLDHLPKEVLVKIKSKTRIYDALFKAVNSLVTDKNIPISSLTGFISNKLYRLQEKPGIDNPLVAYQWPEPAFDLRWDGGLLHLFLDGKELAIPPIADERRANRAVSSLQHQVDSSLLYGPKNHNAVVDLSSSTIYVPKNTEAYAKIIEFPLPIRQKDQAYGRGTITFTDPATSDGDISLTDSSGNAVSVSVSTGESEELVAEKVSVSVNNDDLFEARAQLFTDEIRFTTKLPGSDGNTNITFNPNGTGVAVDVSPVSLTAEEPVEIPLSHNLYQEQITMDAFMHIVSNVGQIRSMPAEAPPREPDTGEVDVTDSDEQTISE